jgi:hypothetical protein
MDDDRLTLAITIACVIITAGALVMLLSMLL